MSTKPTVIPNFATATSNIVTPSAGEQLAGWQRGAVAPSAVMNWLHRHTAAWCQYLSDGAFSGDHSIDGDLAVSGTITGAEPEREIDLSGRDFVWDSSAAGNLDTLVAAGMYLHRAAAIGYAIAPVAVRAGDVITLATVHYDLAGGTAMTPKLRRVELATGTVTDVWAGVADATSAGIETQTSGAIAHAVVAGHAYFVEVFATAAANRVHGATIRYRRPAP